MFDKSFFQTQRHALCSALNKARTLNIQALCGAGQSDTTGAKMKVLAGCIFTLCLFLTIGSEMNGTLKIILGSLLIALIMLVMGAAIEEKFNANRP